MNQHRRDSGQALTEYLMVLGLVAAVIIAITGLIMPAIRSVVVSVIRYVAVNLTSVPS